MRLLIDMNLTPRWVHFLRNAGYEAVHWSSVGSNSAKDSEICDYARQSVYVILTNDLDFPQILAHTKQDAPSVVLLRGEPLVPEVRGSALLGALKIAKRNSTRAPSSPSTGRTNRAPRSDSSPQTRLPPGVSRPSATCYAMASICLR